MVDCDAQRRNVIGTNGRAGGGQTQLVRRSIEKPGGRFYGDRRYIGEAPESHRWVFAQHVRDVPAGEMQKAAKELDN